MYGFIYALVMVCTGCVAQEIQYTQDYIMQLFSSATERGYIYESVSQLEHGLQAAAYAASLKPGDTEFILAALLHDVGHLLPSKSESMNGYGKQGHEESGADFLKQCGFSDRVCQLVKGHVQAKRYLCAINSEYYESLTIASQETLKFQGGIMNADEVRAFEQDPFSEDYIKIRECDDHAKDKNAVVPSLDAYATMMADHLARN